MRRQYVDTSFKQTRAQKHGGPEQQRREDEGKRSLNNVLKFWRLCTKAPCRRAHACMGDAQSCLTRHWVIVPQDFKIWFRAAIQARCEGLSPEEANRAGEAEVKRRKELEAQYGHEDERCSGASPQFTSRASESR